ncbi:MAG TPA: hypothetical protein GXZ29_03535, partial [Clostridiales bacterium]|nr:hypothetical protein [Clostridiales bacterium]
MSGKQKVKILVSILLTALMVLYIFPTAALAAGNTDKAPEDLFGLRTGGAANPNKPVRRAQAVYTNRAPVFGADDQVWELAKPYTVDQVIYDYDAGTPSKGVFRVLWDDNNLYIRVEVTDDGVFGGTSVLRQSDSVEVMVSERNYRGHLVPDNDTDPTRVHDKRKANWYRLSAPAGSGSGEFGRAQARYSNSPWSSSAVNLEADSGWARSIRTDTGFVTEFKIPHYDGSVASKDGVIYGFDILINDAESSNASINERRIITWNNTANDSDGLRVSTVNWGELELTNWAAANSDTAKFVIQENGHRGWKTTTALNIYFSKDVEDLSAEDITLSGLEVTKGALTKVDNRHYILEIGGVTQPERNVAADDPSRYVTVAIDKEGVTTEPASGLVFYEMNAPPAGYEYFVSVHDPNFEERMPVSYGLNDPFQFFVTTDGKSGGFGEVIPNRVVTEKDWEDRRKEIQALAQYYWYGTT